MKIAFYVIALFCMALVSGCASHDKYAMNEPLTPMPEVSVLKDPDNQQFMRAVTEYIHAKEAPGNTRYEFTRLDLNNDGRREGLILLKAPHQYWCNSNGCAMAVFQAHNDHFELKSEMSPIRGPLIISDKETNGWKDIVVKVSGRMDAKMKDVALRFNGEKYPQQPAFQPATRYAYNTIGGVRIFP